MRAVLWLTLIMMAGCSSPVEQPVSEPKAPASPAMKDCAMYEREARHHDSILMAAVQEDPVMARNALAAFSGFAYHCPTNTLTPVFLIKIAQVSRVNGNLQQAKQALENCVEGYPEFENRPAALFMLGQLYDEPGHLNDEKEARKVYDRLIAEYPRSPWADNARAAITLLGKSDEEILRSIRQKSKHE